VPPIETFSLNRKYSQAIEKRRNFAPKTFLGFSLHHPLPLDFYSVFADTASARNGHFFPVFLVFFTVSATPFPPAISKHTFQPGARSLLFPLIALLVSSHCPRALAGFFCLSMNASPVVVWNFVLCPINSSFFLQLVALSKPFFLPSIPPKKKVVA